VSWKNARETADAWIGEHMPDDLRGRAVQLVDFPDDETCRFFYADRDLGFHRMITRAIARIARKRGAEEIHYVQVTRADFRNGDVEKARAFVERCHRFL
jgi:hypothetical protein